MDIQTVVAKTREKNSFVRDVAKIMNQQTNAQQRRQHATNVTVRVTPARNLFQVNQLTVDTFLGAMSITGESSRIISIQLEGKQMSFKLDTGAEVSAISDIAYKTLGNITLKKPAKILVGPTKNALKVLGQFVDTFQIGEKTSTETVFVVSGLKSNLLGLPAIKSLQLLQKIYSVSSLQNIKDRFPNLIHCMLLVTFPLPYVTKSEQS